MIGDKYRDVLDPGDPYWPRVRRLHFYLWANGTLRRKPLLLVLDSFLWLCLSLFGTLFSLGWRIVVVVGVLFLIDWRFPGITSCITRQGIHYELPGFSVPNCSWFDTQYVPSISTISLLVVALFLIHPIRRTLSRVLETLFMLLCIITLGYPLKIVAYVVTLDPNLIGKWLDKSYTLGPLSTGMMLPAEYQEKKDRLWDVYSRSQSPSKEKELEEVLEEYEEEYFK